MITDECVTIRLRDREILAVWPEEATTWNARSRTIEYTPGDETVELSDGDEVAFGGGGDGTDESGVGPAEWLESLDWVSAPNTSCPMESRWYVGGIAGDRGGL